ncbi:MAG: bifunctional 5,10-methylenetetrahydrofolate dehydrogenase/5,10-methenyltetrahydrofolate cyclohydrolase [Patescibacteria group bacterium]
MIIDGKKIAQVIIEKLKSQPKPEKIFAAILVGENPQSESFLKQKEKVAKELGIDFRIYKFSEELKNDDLREEVRKIALLKKVGGVIVQLPLPEHINKHYILNVIPREKDVDVLGERALGAFYTGRNPILPPAVGVVDEILQTTNYKLQTTAVAVVGRGFLVGRPIAVWLMDKVKELGVFGREGNLSELKNYDLVITGVGKAGLIKPEMLKSGAGVIDFGYSIDENGKIHGDFETNLPINQLTNQLNFYTPTPAGTGPILVAKLFENFFKLISFL